jgi:hypothetical protein
VPPEALYATVRLRTARWYDDNRKDTGGALARLVSDE